MYYLSLVFYYPFLWLIQWVTKVWGTAWVDAIEQGGHTLYVRNLTLASEWDSGKAGAYLTCDWFGVFANHEQGTRRHFSVDQYVIW
jgi:hypothetical protein